MKKILRKFTVLLVTFVIGVSAYSIYHRYSLTSLCDIEKNPQRYAGKEIRFRAIFDRSKHFISAGSYCSKESTGWTGIELAPNEVTNFPLPITDYDRGREPERIYLMDAIVVGQMDSYIGMGCFGPKYNIKNVRVERVISIREFEKSEQSLEWLKSNSY